MRHWRLAVLAAAGVLVIQGTAFASSISFASTTIDWSQFSSTVAITYTSQYSIPIAEANANGVQAPQVRNNLGSWGAVSSTNVMTNTLGYGSTTASTVYAEGQALADGIGTMSSAGSAFVGRGGYFTITTPTTLNFSVPFSYQHALTFGSPGDSGYAQSMLFLWLGFSNGTTIDSQVLNFFDTGASGAWSSSGTLTLTSAAVLAPGTYAFDISAFAAASASTQTPVPEPSTLLLLGLGLAGGYVFRRRLTGR